MLIRLIPDQVEERWERFAPAIARALPPTVSGTKRAMVNILEAILLEKLVVWIITDEDQERIFGIVTTKLDYEEVSKTRNLLIYTFTSFGETHYTQMKDAIKTLKKYAVSENCTYIEAYTANERLMNFLEETGFYNNYNLMELEV